MGTKGKRWRVGIAAVLGVATAAVLVLGPSSSAPDHIASASTNDHSSAVEAKAEFQDAMQRLWVDHVTWTRLFIVSFVADLPDLQATTDRLLQNQVDIGDAVKPFYGDVAGDQLTALLEEHILTAADLLTAAKAGDDAAFHKANRAWYANADEIAGFLHDANPRNWPLADMRQMMKDHLDLTLEEAAAQLGGDYAASVAVYDEVETEILHMADMLSSGLIAQFPPEFAKK
jgi:hypothetical protein